MQLAIKISFFNNINTVLIISTFKQGYQRRNDEKNSNSYSEVNKVEFASSDSLLPVGTFVTAFYCHGKYRMRPRAVCVHVCCTDNSYTVGHTLVSQPFFNVNLGSLYLSVHPL